MRDLSARKGTDGAARKVCSTTTREARRRGGASRACTALIAEITNTYAGSPVRATARGPPAGYCAGSNRRAVGDASALAEAEDLRGTHSVAIGQYFRAIEAYQRALAHGEIRPFARGHWTGSASAMRL